MSKHRALEIGYYVTASKKRYFYVTKQTHKREFNPSDRDRPCQYNTSSGKVFMRPQGRNNVYIQANTSGRHYLNSGDWVADNIRLILGKLNGRIMQVGEAKFQKIAETVLAYNTAYNKNSGLTIDDFCIQYADRATLVCKADALGVV